MTGHGGNIYRASEKTGIPEQRIIDFSASINPLGLPASAAAAMKKHMSMLPHYPEPFSERLGLHIAKHYRVNSEAVICGNGSTELIYLIPRALKPRKVLVTAPAFSEYERACRISNKLRVMSHELKPGDNFDINPDEFISAMSADRNSSRITQHASRPFDMAFLCNPNNPTGRLLKKRDVIKIADAARELECCLVVDEAFIDFCPGASVIKEVRHNQYLIVLRSLTKFYALSGLRIGFGIFPQRLAELMKKHKEPWSVNSLAQEAGKAALSDTAYQRASLSIMKTEKKFLEDHFKRLSVEWVPSSTNYYLIRAGNARKIISVLSGKGILVRDCSNFTGLGETYIRVAVRSRKENELLVKELSALCPA
jgi:threonine-phosphate decarboxylase